MQSRPSTIVRLTLILGVLAFNLGCGLLGDLAGGVAEKAVEGVVERVVEEGLLEGIELPPGVLPEELELSDLPVELLTGGTASWPDWAPNSLPEYAYGDIQAVIALPDQDGGSLIITNLQTDRDPFASYVRELEQNGWVEEEGWVFPEAEGQGIAMTRDGYWLQYAVITEGDETVSATLTVFATEE